MRPFARVLRLLPVVVVLAGVGIGARCAPSVAYASATQTYATRGVVRSFGPERRFVNIAHEKIDGYMGAMTMSFEPRTSTQLAGLAAGDRVRLSFTATEDGRRWIDSIQKEP